MRNPWEKRKIVDYGCRQTGLPARDGDQANFEKNEANRVIETRLFPSIIDKIEMTATN
jgi:hypothetical protein